MNLGYYLYRKSLSDKVDSFNNLCSYRAFGHPETINSNRKYLINNLVHTFKN